MDIGWLACIVVDLESDNMKVYCLITDCQFNDNKRCQRTYLALSEGGTCADAVMVLANRQARNSARGKRWLREVKNMVWRIEELKVYAEQLLLEMEKGKLDANTGFDKLKSAIDTKYKADVLGIFP